MILIPSVTSAPCLWLTGYRTPRKFFQFIFHFLIWERKTALIRRPSTQRLKKDSAVKITPCSALAEDLNLAPAPTCCSSQLLVRSTLGCPLGDSLNIGSRHIGMPISSHGYICSRLNHKINLYKIKQGESHIPPSDTATWHNHLQNLRWRTTSLFRTLLFSVGLYLQPSKTIDRACLVYYKWWKHKIIPLTSNLGQLQKYAFFRFIYSEEKKPDFLRLTWLHSNSCCPAWSIWIWGNIFFVWKVKITVVWALLGCGKN